MKFKSSLFVGAVALAATSLVAISAQAGDKLRWKMQSTWGSQVAINGESAVYFSNKVKEISNGENVWLGGARKGCGNYWLQLLPP